MKAEAMVDVLRAVRTGHEDCQGIGGGGCHGVVEGLASCNGTGRKYPGLTRPCPGGIDDTGHGLQYCLCDGSGTLPVEPMVAAMVLLESFIYSGIEIEFNPFADPREINVAFYSEGTGEAIRTLGIGKAATAHAAVLAAAMQETGLEVSDA